MPAPSYPLDIVLEPGPYPLASRRERWTVRARNYQEALKTVAYHFGIRMLWFKLDEPTAAPQETTNG
jgi:hypothetical protein